MIAQKFPAPAFKLIDVILAVTNYTENGYDLELLHDSNAPNEVWIEARSTGKGRTGEVLVAQCWRAAVITLEEGRVGETTAILNVIGEESADQWEILGGGEWDHTESGYRLHQLSYASTAERVVAIWWEGAIRRWWDALNAPDKMSAQAEHNADAPKIGAPRLAELDDAQATAKKNKLREYLRLILRPRDPQKKDVAAGQVGLARTTLDRYRRTWPEIEAEVKQELGAHKVRKA